MARRPGLLCDAPVSFLQGVWKPRKIQNPAFFEDLQPFRMTAFSAVGLELWSMTSDIFFDNFFITDDRITADRWAADGWGLKKAAEGAADVSKDILYGAVIKGKRLPQKNILIK